MRRNQTPRLTENEKVVHPETAALSTELRGLAGRSFNRLDLAADHGLTIFTYAAEPGSRSEEALKLLGSWAATLDEAESTNVGHSGS